MITTPSVLGKSEKDATKELKNAGFKVIVATEEDQSKDNDKVIKQSIDAGTEVEDESSITITVNKIVKTKTATLTVNVKSILGGKYTTEVINTGEKDAEGNPITSEKIKDVKVKITVGADTVFNESVDPTTPSLIQSISGKGTVTVKVYIDDVLKKTKDVNLNDTNKLTIE